MSALRALRRTLFSSTTTYNTQVRHATLLRRPKRPYTFTQLVTLSDGSTFVQRTTSPVPVYKATKDTRNSPLWQPSSQKLLNVEEDEAGKLAAFRAKFGRGWDAEQGKGAAKVDHFMDLISGNGKGSEAAKPDPKAAEAKATHAKGAKK
ncbi:hypothetical protein N0V90_010330 [Kalmusia sp. IMI 367209]|nr:hypothetical protein N0V90_010330 [Kalmusia sp. IMI 367209]